MTVYEGTHVVARGKLDGAGRFDRILPPGSYSAAIRFDALGLTIRKSAPVQVADGGEADIVARFAKALRVMPDPN